ncbi:MAG: hypothetical protein KC729_21595, partial [Candidatus Eisenbacteria bacterium]|nr:hypothetical protein [Candidatus Eisenbacteria bacterium]
ALNDLVPQLWLREDPGVTHELRWSPVFGATRYQILRAAEGNIPTTFSTSSLDTTLSLPPGFQGGTDITYRVQAELSDGRLSAPSEERTGNEPGSVPPSAVSDLTALITNATEIVLRWTAPGDDGTSGQATRYDLRYSTTPITDETFSSATALETAPPNNPGAGEFAVASSLDAQTTYYFALVTFDEADNRSPLSNVLEIETPAIPDTEAPSAVTDLTIASPEEGVFELTWTAPSDARDGDAAGYELRYSTSTLDDATFPAATLLSDPPTPGDAGTQESLRIASLSPGTYSFALRSLDAAGNASTVSNVVSASNADLVPPGAVTDLSATALGGDRIRLAWTVQGDNAELGRADHQEIRVATTPIDEAGFPDATPIAAPVPTDPGTTAELEVDGIFGAETIYYFAIRTVDEAGNVSAISNPATATTPDFEPPAATTDVVAEEVTGTRAKMYWTAPGDNGDRGTATTYDMRFSFEPLTEDNFADAAEVTNLPEPAPAGTNEEVTLVASQAV